MIRRSPLLEEVAHPLVEEVSHPLVEEVALATVTRPGEETADRLRGLVTGARAPSSTSGGAGRQGALLDQRHSAPLVEEVALATVTRPGEEAADR